MTDRSAEQEQASREAADWMARLNRRSVDAHTVEDFFAWRRKPGNGAAYERLEELWRDSERLHEDRDISIALGQALRPRRWRDHVRELIRPPFSPQFLASAIGVLLIALAAAYWMLQPLAYETQIGEQRLIALEDGSRVRLNTDSRIELRFSDDERRIDLEQGEAYFEVAHASPPFVVQAGPNSVTALGTRFDVRRSEDALEVVLAQGSVAVADGYNPGAATQRLGPGQAIRLAPGTPAKPRRVDVNAAIGWTEGRLTFTETPLAQAIAEVNRYTRRGVRLDAPAFAQAKVNGTFETGDTAAFVAAVTALFPLRAAPQPDGGTAIVPAS